VRRLAAREQRTCDAERRGCAVAAVARVYVGPAPEKLAHSQCGEELDVVQLRDPLRSREHPRVAVSGRGLCERLALRAVGAE